MELYVGSKVRLLRAMLGEPVGSIGYIYENYDLGDGNGVSIIFQAGGYDGFSPTEQDLYLEHIGEDPRYSSYEFKNVNRVWDDWKNGYWNFNG